MMPNVLEQEYAMDFDKELSVKGYCFRAFKDNHAVARMVRECGLDRIDLSGVQLNFKEPSQHQPAIDAFQDAGVKIVGIGALALTGEDADEEYFRFCRNAGCATISVTGKPETFVDALRRSENWAEAYGMRLAIHNHGGKHWLGSSEMLRYVLGRTGPRVGLCLDTAWCLQAGEDPLAWAKEFAGRIFAVHFKDFTFDAKGHHRDVVVGEGALDLPGFVKALEAGAFDGPAIIEYEADSENPVPALAECVRRMRSVFATFSRA